MPFLVRAKQRAKRSKWLLVGYIIANSARLRMRSSLGRIDSLIGAVSRNRPLEETVRYIHQVYDDYLEYGGLCDEAIRDKRIVEIGPGDNVAVALKFLAAGAAQVVCLDRFKTIRDPDHERRIYLAVRDRLSEPELRRFDDAVDLRDGIRFNESRLRCVYGVSAEQADRVLGPASADVVISRAVIEEVYRVDELFQSMHRLLAPGGRMAHKIDLRDYGMFSANGYHPLEFLTIPDVIYDLMSKNAARPNRRRMDYYRRKMSEFGYEAGIYITCVVRPESSAVYKELVPHKANLESGVDYDDRTIDAIGSVRPRLARRFRDLSDENLMAGSIFLAARKPDECGSL